MTDVKNTAENDSKTEKADATEKKHGKEIRFVLTPKNTLGFLFYLLLFGLLVFLVYITTEAQKSLPEKFFSKDIKANIQTVIKNGGKLDIVKHIYLNREIKNRGLIIPYFTKIEENYTESTTLTTILNDIKKDYFLKDQKDSLFLISLEKIISEHEEINPFDKLQSNQKFMFENVRQKLDSNYLVVREDLNRISDELNNRNILVAEYLDKSELSYWISIIALALTVIFSLIQIFQNIKKKDKKVDANTEVPAEAEEAEK